MGINEKRDFVKDYCGDTNCGDCKLRKKWIRKSTDECLPIADASEAELDLALELINGTRNDSVNHPKHYESGKFECIDVMAEAIGLEDTKGFCLCNAFKYIYRCTKKHKTPVEDVKKAIWYLNKFLELEGEQHDQD